jgi:hypothetical protein
MRQLLIRLAVLIGVAAAAGLGADVAVAGTGKAAELAGVIAGFCELGAVLLGVVAWAGDRRPGAVPTEVAKKPVQDSPASAAKYVVDARHARGVQAGDGAAQHNDFRTIPGQRRGA